MTPKEKMSGRVLWILGASDPEMERVEALLDEHDELSHHAVINGRRVRPFEAYEADIPGLAPDVGTIALVECGLARVTDLSWRTGREVIQIDHHRPGDYGYGLPPEDYWTASSIGQVCCLLDHEPSDDLLLAAAADHCPAAAYQGRCPDVDPAALRQWRAEVRAAYQHRPVEDVLADVDAALTRIGEAPMIRLGGVDVVDLRGRGTVPELPEATLLSGRCVIAEIPARRPAASYQVTLQGAGTGTTAGARPIKSFLGGWGRAQGYYALYGDAGRGFAGGYRD